MIHELRVYTLWPGKVPEFLKLAGERAMKIRGNDYGKCLGYWSSEIGVINQIFHLWEYEDLNARAALRAKLGENKTWRSEYVRHVHPLVRHQAVRLLHPQRPFKAPDGKGNVYEYRNYRLHTGKAAEWLGHFEGILPTREKYSPNVCCWLTESPEPNEVSHLWVYPDLNARAKTRAAFAADPAWGEFLPKSGPLMREMNSTILIPAPFSPVQ